MDVRSLSGTEAKVILSLEAEARDLITLDEIRRRAGVSPGFARKIAHELVGKGWLQRVRRGTYLLNPSQHGPDALPDADPLRLGSRLAEPYYFGYATAAELEGLLPQASRVYYLVTTSRAPVSEARFDRFRFVRVLPRHFFGFHRLRRRGVALVVSNLERTILDCLRRPELSGGMAGVAHVLALAKPRLNWSRFGSYLERFGNRSLTRRAGFLTERVRPSIPPPASWAERNIALPNAPYVPLGPPSSYGRRGVRDRRWHIVRNVTDSELFAEGEIR
ncbi:MAG: type IV toxin-antitoxin system AbiEi family antitoxin domain-containing protein [Thermoplasmata archaeon]